MIWRLYRLLYYLNLRDRLDMTPHMIADEYSREEITHDIGRVFTDSQARSPRTTHLLQRRFKTESVDELLDILPSRKRRRQPRLRLAQWIARLQGLLPYEPNVKPSLRRAAREGRLSSHTTLVRRTSADDLHKLI